MSLLRSVVRSSGKPSAISWTVAGPSSHASACVCPPAAPALSRSFALSSPRAASTYKRNKRENEKARKESTERKKREWYADQPDPYLGVKLEWDDKGFPLHEQRWRQTKLASLILDPQTLWTTGPNAPKQIFSTLATPGDDAAADGPAENEIAREEAEVLGEDAAGNLRGALDDPAGFEHAAAESGTELSALIGDGGSEVQAIAPPRIADFPIPRYLSHQLPAADREFLFRTLPKTVAAASVPMLPPSVKLTDADHARRETALAQAEAKETPRLEAMARILSLRNASAAQIKKESIKNVVEAFGAPEVRSFKRATPKARKGPDTGSIEVQIAVLTVKIRAMRAALAQNLQDHDNARRIKLQAHKRKRLFEYLKRRDPVRYEQCLMETGIDKRAVEGELVIHRWWRQVPVQFAQTSKDRTKYVGKVGHHGTSTKLKRRVFHPKKMGGQAMEAHF